MAAEQPAGTTTELNRIQRRAKLTSLSKLQPHPDNPRTITDQRLLQLQDAMVADPGMLEARPLIALPDGRVIGGNQRLAAAQALGWKRIPVVTVDLDDATAKVWMLRDNNGYGEWDDAAVADILGDLGEAGVDAALAGFDSAMLERLLGPVGRVRGLPPEPADRPANPRSMLGEVYELGPHRLMCGDSTDPEDVAVLMGDAYASLLFTSPPYLDAREYGGEKNLEVEHLAEFLLCYAAFADLICVNLGLLWRDGELVPYWDVYTAMAHQAGLRLLSWNVWNREEAGSIAQATAMFPVFHEWVLVYGLRKRKLNRTTPNKHAGKGAGLTVRQSDGRVLPTNGPATIQSHKALPTMFSCAPVKGDGRQGHPAVFPVEFARAYIETATDKDDVVIDPFAGAGTTLIAAEMLGRRCFAMELDPGYCDVIRDRWEAWNGST